MTDDFTVFVNLGAVDSGLYCRGVAQEIESVGTAELVGVGGGVSGAPLAETQGDVFFATTRRSLRTTTI